MDKLKMPEISPDFTMEDLYKIREYNSLRWSEMTFEEMQADIREGAEKMQALIEQFRCKKELATVE